jgi:hypothetical protein
VISIRNDSRSPEFHSSKIAAMAGRLQPRDVREQVVGLGDELDVGVLDAVVHHLHVVPGPVRAHVHAAGGAVDDRGDAGEDLLDLGVGGRVAAGHDARPEQRALLAAGHPDAHEPQAAPGELGRAALGVREVGVAGVDDDVALVEQGRQLRDHGVDGQSRLDHHDDAARPLQRRDEVLQRLGRGERALPAVQLHELGRAGGGAVVHRHRHPASGDVAGEVRPHHRESRDTDPALRVDHGRDATADGGRPVPRIRPAGP